MNGQDSKIPSSDPHMEGSDFGAQNLLRDPLRTTPHDLREMADEKESSNYAILPSDQTLGERKSLLRCIVKLGGAAITCKNELESINEEILKSVCEQLREAMVESTGSSTGNVVSMDWSRWRGNPPVSAAEEFKACQSLDLDSNFIVVHGAGSFGHFQASTSGVHKGGLDLPLVKAGFVATRISVTSLNLEIVRALSREGIPSVGISPFACGWSTHGRNISSVDASQVIKAIHSGFVPTLHGDAVLDELQDCTILSGDVIIRHLSQLLMPNYVVFLTDVLGVYDRPPADPNAILLKKIGQYSLLKIKISNCLFLLLQKHNVLYMIWIEATFQFIRYCSCTNIVMTAVDENGNWSIVKPKLQHERMGVKITVAAHDTTGGMETKIAEAAMIAKLGINVYITKAGTPHSLRALRGEVGDAPDDWLGTVICSSKHTTYIGNH
ncbi:hypothetical protein Cni_G19217 [Canna indica]|uniref:Isopentenyl phosphate kinase n=1 Tax=Canna indica TaxID=4628 RepID=A0AAQ3KMS9_9LILI|nr:hypothetical protein Cni_G19217 [Canna indica]